MKLLKTTTLLSWISLIKQHRGLLFRILFCWFLGVILLFSDTSRKIYDYRFAARGPQSYDQDIVILQISQSEWDEYFQPSLLNNMIYKGTTVSDNYYWNSVFWLRFIEALKKLQPKAIGVSFFFGSNIATNWKLERYFTESPVIWIAETDTMGRILAPKFADSFSENVGLNLLQTDSDGVIRQFLSSPFNIPQFAETVSNRAKIKYEIKKPLNSINYRGASGTFKTYSIADIIDNNAEIKKLSHKILLIGPEDGREHTVKTPLGTMSRLELYANIIDNIKNDRWIKQLPNNIYILIILALVLFTAALILNLPQSISITLLCSFSFFYFATSVFLFDVYYIWTPLMSSISVIVLTYVVIISQLLFDKEQNMWRLQKEQENLSAMEQLKTNFVSLISHDLKTPLAKIQSVTHRALSRLPQEPESSELKEELQSIYKETKNLDRYIKSILQLSKIESKDFLVKKEPLDINELIESAAEQLVSVAKEKNINLKLELEPLFLIEADKVLLREIILNIIENAIKYTFENTDVLIKSYEEEGKDLVVVEVKDNGPGIKKEHLEHVYKKFFRADPNNRTQGSGLGLFLVKYFLDLHKGEINIESTVNQGTKVTMKIPTGV